MADHPCSICGQKIGHDEEFILDEPVNFLTHIVCDEKLAAQSRPEETSSQTIEDDEDDPRLAEAIARSEAQFARGEGIPAEDVIARLRDRRHGGVA